MECKMEDDSDGRLSPDQIATDMNNRINIGNTEARTFMYDYGKLFNECDDDFCKNTYYAKRIRYLFRKGRLTRPSSTEIQMANEMSSIPPLQQPKYDDEHHQHNRKPPPEAMNTSSNDNKPNDAPQKTPNVTDSSEQEA